MSSNIGDLATMRSLSTTRTATSNKTTGTTNLDMDDFLQIMVAQFQNQDPENAADTSDMLNMLVQMTSVQGMKSMTDASTMTYTASLVGKEVTVGVYDKNNKLVEVVGTVTATGTYNGDPVVFVDGVSYALSSIMAVGRLPGAETTDPTTEEEATAESVSAAEATTEMEEITETVDTNASDNTEDPNQP
ncbi:MAG: flgD [Firmicutes bacterium]|nr:flgD [Bacillota bacterium]